MKTIVYKEPQPLESILKRVWKKLEKKRDEAARRKDILDKLEGVVGKKHLPHLKLAGLSKKVLLIEVDNSICLSELYAKRDEIVEAINTLSKRKFINKVNFRIQR